MDIHTYKLYVGCGGGGGLSEELKRKSKGERKGSLLIIRLFQVTNNTRLISALRRATLNNEPVHVWSGIWALFRERKNTRLSLCW
jgi:hypothetical protein